MSGFDLNDDGDDTFLNLLNSGWNNPNAGSSSNPNAGSSSNPNPLGMSSQEAYEQHQAMLFYEQQSQANLNTNFSNLQFIQHSQQSQTATHDVPDTPTSPPKKNKSSRIKRKARKTKNPEPLEDDDEENTNIIKRWNPQEYIITSKKKLRDHLESYTSDYTMQVLVGYCTVYIFMQTFMIPGTVFMSLLAGSLFGVLRGVALVVFAATAGASSCYFLSKLIGRPLINYLWPDKLVFFQDQVAKRRGGLLNYMLFLRVTPTLPNTFINVASPIVNVPYHIFFLATSIGLIPAAYVTVKAGIALGELCTIGDLYDIQLIGTLFLIGIISVTPTLITNKNKPKYVWLVSRHEAM